MAGKLIVTKENVPTRHEDEMTDSDFDTPLTVKGKKTEKPAWTLKKTIGDVDVIGMKRKRDNRVVSGKIPEKVIKDSKSVGKAAGKKTAIKKKHAPHKVPYIRTKSSPRPLFNSIQSMNNLQKQAVVGMGFGGMLDLAFEEIPARMGYWLVDSFDERTCKIRMKVGSIKVTKTAINQMLGVPIGGLEINTCRISKSDDVVTQEWRNQFGKTKGTIRPEDVERIKIMEDDGRLFKLNFLVLFATTMAESTKCGTCNQKFLSCIVNDDDIKNLDWCGYILDCLKHNKGDWDREHVDCFYTGPLTLLTLFYIDSTMCRRLQVTRRRPAIKGWTLELLRSREVAELKLGGFGRGHIEPPMTNEDLNKDDVNSGAKKAT